MSAVYFARFGDYVKIGIADRPEHRLKVLASGRGRLIYPEGFELGAPGELALVIPGCRHRDESNLHLLFARHWVVGEWFRWSPAFRYQMRTMDFVTHAERLRDLRRARRALGIAAGAVKEAHFGKTARERIAAHQLEASA